MARQTTDRWEYHTLRPPRGSTKKEAIDPSAELNELGKDGWELVDTIEYVGGGTKFLVFKRPARQGDKTDNE
ncbi:DUF4177 domain-containing protein [Haladaptatus halobius]|uniref:DUF4177 domain-containing protein n=1 Tax=Haladaptatus halobius TaxID=2884875 RepID=UPI001D0A9F35|nr:DUF4177 domain-containing protein [Haladaptatus halobius]